MKNLPALSKTNLTLAALLFVALAPKAAGAVQSAELYGSQAYFYGRFEARIRFAPGEGVVSSFFLWKDGSSSTTPWNELDFEKINSTCHLQTNIWSGMGTQSSQLNTPTFNICSDYHTYAFEWTPDYIAWSIDGTQVRKVTGSLVTFYTQNASAGMSMHFNTWAGNSTFGGTLDPSILPVHEYISWAQYSSYSNNAFQLQWRQEFDGSSMPANWAAGDWASPYNLSTHNKANVTFGGGIAVLSMTADGATGFTGTPPVDSMAVVTGTGGTPGTGGTTATGGATGTGGKTATGGTVGAGGTMPTGGTTGNGGSTATGGTPGAGGSSSTGGNTATGGTTGNTGAGGVVGTGGTSATGGVPGTGGDSATGGTPGTGGMASGGSPGASGSSSGCSCRAGGDGPDQRITLMAVLLIGAWIARRRRAARPAVSRR